MKLGWVFDLLKIALGAIESKSHLVALEFIQQV